MSGDTNNSSSTGAILTGLGLTAASGFFSAISNAKNRKLTEKWNKINLDNTNYWNERNSITGRIQEGAQNGLNPLTASGLSSNSGSATVSAPQNEAFNPLEALQVAATLKGQSLNNKLINEQITNQKLINEHLNKTGQLPGTTDTKTETVLQILKALGFGDGSISGVTNDVKNKVTGDDNNFFNLFKNYLDNRSNQSLTEETPITYLQKVPQPTKENNPNYSNEKYVEVMNKSLPLGYKLVCTKQNNIELYKGNKKVTWSTKQQGINNYLNKHVFKK